MTIAGEKLPFFTPFYTSPPGEAEPTSRCCFLDIEESYFNWGNTYARQLDDHHVVIVNAPRYSSIAQEVFCKILLVASYLTVIIPIVMLIAKAIFRCGTQSFVIQHPVDRPNQPDEIVVNQPRLEEVREINALQNVLNRDFIQLTGPIEAKPEAIEQIKTWAESNLDPLANVSERPAVERWDLLMAIAHIFSHNPIKFVQMNRGHEFGEINARRQDRLRYFAAQLTDSLNQHIVPRPTNMQPIGGGLYSTPGGWSGETWIESLVKNNAWRLFSNPPISALQVLLRLLNASQGFYQLLTYFPVILDPVKHRDLINRLPDTSLDYEIVRFGGGMGGFQCLWRYQGVWLFEALPNGVSSCIVIDQKPDPVFIELSPEQHERDRFFMMDLARGDGSTQYSNMLALARIGCIDT